MQTSRSSATSSDPVAERRSLNFDVMESRFMPGWDTPHPRRMRRLGAADGE